MVRKQRAKVARVQEAMWKMVGDEERESWWGRGRRGICEAFLVLGLYNWRGYQNPLLPLKPRPDSLGACPVLQPCSTACLLTLALDLLSFVPLLPTGQIGRAHV